MKLIFRQQAPHGDELSTFTFEPVEPLTWVAGQSIRLELPAPDYGTNERRFTISSAPYEKVIAITTRRSTSEFKQLLFTLEPGDIIDAYSIEGDFIWEDDIPAIFVALGIGVTPFYAILKQRLHEQKTINTELLYASKSTLPFAADFQQWQLEHPEFTLHQLDRITAGQVHERGVRRTPYISGPQAFVTALKQELVNNYHPEIGTVKTDLFTGNLPEEG